MEIKTGTVSQINGYIKRILDSNQYLNTIRVKGEISNFKRHYSGHIYITLKDENSVLKAVMFRGTASKLNFEPKDGMKVIAQGRITAYEQGGQYQLYIEDMVPDGIGDLYVKFEQMKARLSKEGLFDERFKKPIPRFPEKIGVVTASTGAAVRDIINVISRRFPYAEIILYPSLVQGAQAAENIAEAIKYFNLHCRVDTLIVGRGGGSIEDLWAFNEEEVARAIFDSDIPIISAVGHETDFTIADFVADMRAPTPSAAAEISVPSQTELEAYISGCRGLLIKSMLEGLQSRRLLIESRQLKNPTDKINDMRLRIDREVKSLEHLASRAISSRQKGFAGLCASLQALSPLAVMARGYAIAESKDGVAVKSTSQLPSGEKFTLILSDGTVACAAE